MRSLEALREALGEVEAAEGALANAEREVEEMEATVGRRLEETEKDLREARVRARRLFPFPHAVILAEMIASEVARRMCTGGVAPRSGLNLRLPEPQPATAASPQKRCDLLHGLTEERRLAREEGPSAGLPKVGKGGHAKKRRRKSTLAREAAEATEEAAEEAIEDEEENVDPRASPVGRGKRRQARQGTVSP